MAPHSDLFDEHHQAPYVPVPVEAQNVRYGDVWCGAMVRQIERQRPRQVTLVTGPRASFVLGHRTVITVERRLTTRARVDWCPRCGSGPTSLVYIHPSGDGCGPCLTSGAVRGLTTQAP